MTNLTISVPEELLRRARARAADQGTSVSQVLRGSLRAFADDEAEVGEAWEQFLGMAAASEGHSAEGHRTWRRSDLQRDTVMPS